MSPELIKKLGVISQNIREHGSNLPKPKPRTEISKLQHGVWLYHVRQPCGNDCNTMCSFPCGLHCHWHFEVHTSRSHSKKYCTILGWPLQETRLWQRPKTNSLFKTSNACWIYLNFNNWKTIFSYTVTLCRSFDLGGQEMVQGAGWGHDVDIHTGGTHP
jgi:hypothetical protein